jgi:hypothetical protein
MEHSFIFTQGTWIGEGKIMLSMVEEELLFTTRWSIQSRDFSGKVQGIQDITIQGLSENMRNELTFYEFQNKIFKIDMENQNVGRIIGAGVYDENLIGWEFRNNDMNFEGFETYQLQEDGSYLMRGEYVTRDQFRTQLEARLWLHSQDIHFNEEGGEPHEGEEPDGSM